MATRGGVKALRAAAGKRKSIPACDNCRRRKSKLSFEHVVLALMRTFYEARCGFELLSNKQVHLCHKLHYRRIPERWYLHLFVL
jgi:hypothetical protein